MSEFFKVFTFVVWEKILEKLEDPKDKLNLLTADLDLENHFQYKRKEWRFAAILPIFVANYGFTRLIEEEQTKLKKSVLSCRLMSSLCCKAIDNYVENYYDENYEEAPSFFYRRKAHIYSARVTSLFLEEMGNHPPSRPPIICRGVYVHVPALTLDVDEVDEDETFITKHELAKLQLRMLDKAGTHLKRLEFTYQASFSYPPLMFQYFQMALSKTPNLKSLMILVVIGDDPFHNADISSLPFLPMPPLPQLKRLDIFFQQPVPFVMQLLSFQVYFPGLVILRMPFTLWKEEYNRNSKELFPNLKSMELLRTRDGTQSEMKEKALKLLELIDAPKLEELEVPLVYSENESGPSDDAISVKEFGLSCMKTRYPRAIWKCEIAKWSSSVKFFKTREIFARDSGDGTEEEKINQDKGHEGGSGEESNQTKNSVSLKSYGVWLTAAAAGTVLILSGVRFYNYFL